MEIEEIINVWKSLGWNNAADYHKSRLTKEIEEKIQDIFDPDKIDVKKFWRATDIHFSTDTVCNSYLSGGNEVGDFEESNYLNHRLALWMGLIGSVDFCVFNAKRKFKKVSIAEIGCGYGSFKEHYAMVNKDVDRYDGFDIIPRYRGVIEIGNTDGSFSDEQIATYTGKYNIFYSCNVFQHLSPKQIEKYFEQVYQMLPEGGYFIFTYTKPPSLGFTWHYGQKVQIEDDHNLISKCIKTGFTLWGTHKHERMDGSLVPIGFCLEKNSLNRTKV
jgi:SAM-dependent methyltransferase